jgi:hypothetical protein
LTGIAANGLRYTNTDPSKIYEKRFIIAALTEDALSDTAPLFETISRYVDANLLAKIAAEYEKGRLQLILHGHVNSAHRSARLRRIMTRFAAPIFYGTSRFIPAPAVTPATHVLGDGRKVQRKCG